MLTKWPTFPAIIFAVLLQVHSQTDSKLYCVIYIFKDGTFSAVDKKKLNLWKIFIANLNVWGSDNGFRNLHSLQKYKDYIVRFVKNSSDVAMGLFVAIQFSTNVSLEVCIEKCVLRLGLLIGKEQFIEEFCI